MVTRRIPLAIRTHVRDEIAIKNLTKNPYVTAKKLAEQFQVAFTTAQRAIEKLENLEILSQVTHSKRDRVYCATALLKILEQPAII